MKEDISKGSMGQAWISLSTASEKNLFVFENLLRNLGMSANTYGMLNRMLSLQLIGLHVKAPGNKKEKCFKSNEGKTWSQAEEAKSKIPVFDHP